MTRMLQVSQKGNRISKETEGGRLSFDTRNHHIYLGRKNIAKFEDGEVIIVNTSKVDKYNLENDIDKLMTQIIEG